MTRVMLPLAVGGLVWAAAISGASLPVAGQSSGAPPPAGTAEPAPAEVSRECQTPGLRISGDIPLPNVTKAIRIRKTIKILSIGASRTGGKGNTDRGYQAIIESALERTIPGVDVKMIDRGISGELAGPASERIKSEVALVRPDLVLWQVGTHDALMHVPVDEFKATVSAALDWLKSHEVDVVLVGLHYLRRLAPDKHYQDIRAALRAVADEKHVLWIKRYDAMQVIDQARRSAGGSSPNEFAQTEHGYDCLSEYVVRALVSGTFARPPRQPPGG